MKKILQEEQNRIIKLMKVINEQSFNYEEEKPRLHDDDVNNEPLIDAISDYVLIQRKNGYSLEDIEKALIIFVQQNIEVDRQGEEDRIAIERERNDDTYNKDFNKNMSQGFK